MMVSLIKKDFLLAKKAIVRALVISLIIIPFLIVNDGDNSFQNTRFGIFIFLYFVILMMVTWLSQVAVEEEKNPHAAALLCAAPYSRKNFVIAKYLCYLILFAGCAILYSIIPALYQGLNFLNVTEFLLVFLVGTVSYGLYTTVAIKDGIAKARYVISVILLLMVLVPFGISSIFHHDLTSVMQFISNQSRAVFPVILGCVSACLFFIFMFASIHCFEKKEL